jgi:putative heme-binding domain-containing protein
MEASVFLIPTSLLAMPHVPTLLRPATYGSLWLICCSTLVAADPAGNVQFRRLTLSEEFHSEGADFADFDGDGHHDVVSGPFWYAGPEFRTRHRYAAGERHAIEGYSDHFFSFADDFNADGRPDILVVGMPGEPAQWFENPGRDVEHWQSHHVLEDVGGESPTLTDVNGNGQRELVCVHGGRFGYASFDAANPTAAWTFTAISPARGLHRFTHGLGVGDVDGDGLVDVLETEGWYQQSGSQGEDDIPGQPYAHREQKFAQSGGAQMFAYDFDGDGDNDVVSVQNAHGWGLTWFERRGDGDDMLWVPHPILTEHPGDNPAGLAISQMHAVALADMDGDGVKDIVTGKRFFAHGGKDPGAFQLPVLYWFRTVRGAGGVQFEPHLIDHRVGVGTQLTVGDINGDQRNDIVVGNKLGTFVLLNEPTATPRSESPLLGSPPGTEAFALGVRESAPLSPEQERQTFVLPAGFEAQLVAAEPEIDKPLNMAFDDRGRLWVTTTVEYPYPVEVGTAGRDSIKILEDQDGDGRADKITTFATGLNIPMGLYPYRDGVICFSIPNLWFLRDTDGDGQCDHQEKLYGPFDHTRDAHGLVNALTRGYDGWLYACHGFNNQSSVTGGDGNQVTMHSGNTFRFRTDGSRIEHYTHGQVNPFGMAYDSNGDLLTADCHTKPVTLLMPGGHYESFGRPHDGLGFVPPVMNHLHGSTAIGGIAVCTDRSSFPAVYLDSAFGGNVMTSRINRNSLIYTGASMRAQEEPDFLIAGDPWFRPVDLKFGPDGALYVADFYNRIIGHYEVPLTHPGRDRNSGRIWKIVYRGNDDRRDPAPTATSDQATVRSGDLAALDVEGLIEQLDAPQLTRRMLAADRLADDFGVAARAAVEQAFHDPSSTQRRIHAMWILFRLTAITPAIVDKAVSDADPLLRVHAFRMLAESSDASLGHERILTHLLAGMADSNLLVRRAAVLAGAKHPDTALLVPLLVLDRQTPASDPHLRHAVRMALRDCLRDETAFAQFAQQIPPDQVQLVADISLSLQTPAAARFISANISALAGGDRARLGEYVQFALNHVSDATAAEMVTLARQAFAEDRPFQLELLHAVGESSVDAVPQPIRDWADDIATELLAVDQQVAPWPWQSLSSGDANDPSWVVSDRRLSADTSAPTVLWSSYPRGEQRTGTIRSAVFQLPATFQFFIAGHDGVPNQPIEHKNFVRLCDAVSGETLHRWSPPRNDVAQPVTCQQPMETGAGESMDLTGRRVYLELVDGDAGSAYAWMAVGRFSVPELNPSELLADRRDAAALAGQFRLTALRPGIVGVLKRTDDPATRGALASAVAAIQSDSYSHALAAALAIEHLDPDTSAKLADRLDRAAETIGHAGEAVDLLGAVLPLAASADQLRIVRSLVTDRQGTGLLLDLISAGKASARLLSVAEIESRLQAIATPEQQQLIAELTASLPAEDEQLGHLISSRQQAYVAAEADIERGRQIFAKNCASCHQVAGQGSVVGPNLDGIGNRGLAKICEDVLAPHRNVDAAFRSTTILTDDGRVIAGLVKLETASQLTIVDSTGKSQLIDPDTIETRRQTMLSPMPGNIADLVSEREFNDLLGYLMSLNH